MTEISSPLVLYTTPTTFVRENLPHTEEPFDQILGVEANGEIISVADMALATAQRSYDVPPEFAARLAAYAHRGFGEGLAGKDPRTIRNCFHFGSFMATGVWQPDKQAAWDLMLQEAVDTPPTSDAALAVGDLSVLRGSPQSPEPVLHGLVKIAPEAHIQIMTLGGALGITSVRQAVAYRESPAYKRIVVQGFYGLDPTAWSVGHFAVSKKLRTTY